MRRLAWACAGRRRPPPVGFGRRDGRRLARAPGPAHRRPPPVAGGDLRRRIVRGTLINAVALAGVDLLVLAQGLIVTRLLGPTAIGLYGIVTVTTMTVVGLKRVGVDEAFVAQDEPEQALEFQRAFTLELAISAVFSLILCALAPVVAAIYGDPRLLALMAATAYLPLAFALQAPTWIFFRRMDFARQRLLQGIVPVVTFLVTVPLAAGGAGVWSLVIGPAVGNLAGVVAAVRASPYPLALRWDPATARRYLRFSVWVLASSLAALVVLQGQVLAFDLHDGLAAVGFVTLAATFARYIDRADQIVTVTIYPAICAIRGRTAALAELFVRSNRATLLWTLPAAAGIVLFSPALVDHVLGRAWDPAVPLMQGLAVAAALQQVGFNWFSFYRAHGASRPGAIEAGAGAAAFLAFAVPGLIAAGVHRLRRRALRGRARAARRARALRPRAAAVGPRARRARPAAGAGRARRRRGRRAAARPGLVRRHRSRCARRDRAVRRRRRGRERRPRARPPARARRRPRRPRRARTGPGGGRRGGSRRR